MTLCLHACLPHGMVTVLLCQGSVGLSEPRVSLIILPKFVHYFYQLFTACSPNLPRGGAVGRRSCVPSVVIPAFRQAERSGYLRYLRCKRRGWEQGERTRDEHISDHGRRVPARMRSAQIPVRWCVRNAAGRESKLHLVAARQPLVLLQRET